MDGEMFNLKSLPQMLGLYNKHVNTAGEKIRYRDGIRCWHMCLNLAAMNIRSHLLKMSNGRKLPFVVLTHNSSLQVNLNL